MECLEVKLFNNAIEKYATTTEAIWKRHIFGVENYKHVLWYTDYLLFQYRNINNINFL